MMDPAMTRYIGRDYLTGLDFPRNRDRFDPEALADVVTAEMFDPDAPENVPDRATLIEMIEAHGDWLHSQPEEIEHDWY